MVGADAFLGTGFGAYASSNAYSIDVQLPDTALFRSAEESAAIIDKLIADTVRLALQEVAGRVSDEAGKFADTGALAQSFQSDPATERGGIELTGAAGAEGVLGRVFSSLPYAIVMELGRRAGQPISRAGIDAIGLWAMRKLGLSHEEAERAKWAIAMNIVHHGIEGKHFFEDGVQAATPKVEKLFQILGDQIASALTGGDKGAK